MDLYAELVQRALYPLWEGGIRRRPTLDLLRYMEQTQHRSLDELEALQLGALRRLLRHAHDHVPFYRDRLAAAGMAPADVRTLEDYRRLPILDRETIRSAGTQRASTVAPLPAIHKTTSGTSSPGLSFAYDLGSEHWRQATKLRGYGWAGYRVGVRTLHYWGAGPRPTGFRGAKIKLDRRLRQERWIDCNARGDRELGAVASELRRDPPRVMLCYSQAGADLARFVNRTGARDWPDIHVICAAERLLPADRTALVTAFGPHVFETYGSREVMLMASECEAHDGLHTSMENLLVELVVRGPDGERPAQEGETGEVVLTDLHNYGMPFLRYASGDLAVARRKERCACGRSLTRIGPIEGRVTETLTDGEGGRVSGLLFAIAVTYAAPSFMGFQVIQRRDLAVVIRVVGKTLEPAIEQKLRAMITPYLRGLPLTFECVEALALDPSGKRRQVVVER